MPAVDDRLIPELGSLRTRPLAGDGWEIHEPPTGRVSPGGLGVGAFFLVAAWLFARGFEHPLGWLWILGGAALVCVIARRELTQTSIRLERNVISIRSGFTWSSHRIEMPVEQVREVRVISRRRSRQSATSNSWTSYETYQIALAAGEREIPIFAEIGERTAAGSAAQRLSAMLEGAPAASRAVPVVWPPAKHAGLRLQYGIAIVAAVGLVLFAITRAC